MSKKPEQLIEAIEAVMERLGLEETQRISTLLDALDDDAEEEDAD